MDNTTNSMPETVSSLTAGRADGRPHTIPALKEWYPGSAAYTFSSQAHILIDPASSSQLEMIGTVLADDIEQLTGLRLPVLVAAEAQPGDIVLRLDPFEDTPGAEGYTLSITQLVSSVREPSRASSTAPVRCCNCCAREQLCAEGSHAIGRIIPSVV